MATFDFAAWRRRKQLRGEWIGWKDYNHNHKKVIRGLTDEELRDAIKFIFPAEEENTKECKNPPRLEFARAHWTCLKTLADARSRAKRKEAACSKSTESSQVAMISQWLRGTSF